jgi:hypothetical protein
MTERSRRSIVLAMLAGLAAGGGEPLQAGERTNAQGMGMARTHVAMARGIDALGTNPANLALPDDATITISLLPLGLHLGSDVFSYDLYRRYFTGIETEGGRVGVNLTDADKRDILGRFTNGLGHGVLDVEGRLLGVAVSLGGFGTAALTMTDRVAGSVAVPKEYLEFLFYGNSPGSRYDFGGSEASVAWTREYALSYARPLPAIPVLQSWYGGISLKLVHGLSYAGIDRFKASLATSPVGVLDGTIDVLTRRAGLDPTAEDFGQMVTPFPSPAGTGFGVDLGISGNLDEMIRVGISITDLGSISWQKELRETVAAGTVHLENPFGKGERDSLDQVLKGESRQGTPFTTRLPATLRLGASVELHRLPWFQRVFSGELTVAADYTQGLTHAPGGTVVPRGSLGLEYRPWEFLPLRTGISFGGTDGVSVAFGLGFHFGVYDLDLATENLGWVFAPNSAAYGSFALSMRLRI